MLDTATSQNGRTEEQIVSRAGIPIVMGDATIWLRPLTMDQADEWETTIKGVLQDMFGKLGSASGGFDAVLGLYHASIDAQLDALYAYDNLGGKPVLPDRKRLRGMGGRDDLDEALRKLVKHEFPLLKGMDFLNAWLPTELRSIITRELIRLLPEPSASPPAPSGNGSSTNTPPTKIRRQRARR